MKRLLFLLTLMMGISSMNLYAQTKREEQHAEAQTVRHLVANKRYVISCDRIYPQRGSSRYIGGNYSIEMKGDSLRSYLPYIGVARSASYGGGNVLDFEKVYSDYSYKEGKKGRMIVTMKVDNGAERLEYEITVYSNGKANIRVQPLRCDAVSFSGELELEAAEK